MPPAPCAGGSSRRAACGSVSGSACCVLADESVAGTGGRVYETVPGGWRRAQTLEFNSRAAAGAAASRTCTVPRARPAPPAPAPPTAPPPCLLVVRACSCHLLPESQRRVPRAPCCDQPPGPAPDPRDEDVDADADADADSPD